MLIDINFIVLTCIIFYQSESGELYLYDDRYRNFSKYIKCSIKLLILD